MHKLYELKDALCEELEKYADKEISAGTLEIVDTLAHALKNINKVIEDGEAEEYSNEYRGGSYRDSYGYNGRGSYARGRRNAKRDSMGRYSREDGYSRNEDYIDQLHDMMQNTNDESVRQELQRIAKRMESM